ncbi:hypothetical protein RJ639_033201 [Escallonia herrerae]|uniref:Uncharacterized protein n=1 Tax=Escallonia herrerae TaxID=1293975 RepID=A0AA89B9Z7_9ASTE|nr:hypothetical protein RJ639_033201 [Escallonia herrerae]
MATEATPNFQNPDLILFPHPPDFHAEIAVSAAHDGLHFWQFMITGSMASMVEHMAEHMAMFPIELIKTRMQLKAAIEEFTRKYAEAMRKDNMTYTACAGKTKENWGHGRLT